MSDETEPLDAALAARRGGRRPDRRWPRLKDGVATHRCSTRPAFPPSSAPGSSARSAPRLVAVPGVARHPDRDDRREGASARSSRSAAARAGSASRPSRPISPSRWPGWARRSAWSTPTFTAPPSRGSWAMPAAPSSTDEQIVPVAGARRADALDRPADRARHRGRLARADDRQRARPA